MALVDINWNPSAKELRVFAILQLIFFSLVAWLVHQRLASPGVALGIVVGATVVALIGLAEPRWLREMYVVWMVAVYPIGFVVSHLMMAAVYYLVITPIGLMMRMSGHDPMQRKIDPEAKSYWQPRKPQRGTRGYFRQY